MSVAKINIALYSNHMLIRGIVFVTMRFIKGIALEGFHITFLNIDFPVEIASISTKVLDSPNIKLYFGVTMPHFSSFLR